MSYGNTYQKTRREFFTEQDVERIEKSLSVLANVLDDVTWQWDGLSEVRVVGLLDEPVTFSHPRTAQAALDFYHSGYDRGFGDGNRYIEE